jgi:hypothetical protein
VANFTKEAFLLNNTDCAIEHSTIVRNNRSYSDYIVNVSSDLVNTKAKNSIIIGDCMLSLNQSVYYKLTNCLVQDALTDATRKINCAQYDPNAELFVNEEEYDFHLAPVSQAKQKGDYNFIFPYESFKDKDGIQRFRDFDIDLGAYEFVDP